MFPFLVNVSGASFVCMRLLRMTFLLRPAYRVHRVHRLCCEHRALCTRVNSTQASPSAGAPSRSLRAGRPHRRLGLRGPHLLGRGHLRVPLGPLIAVVSSGIQGTPDN